MELLPSAAAAVAGQGRSSSHPRSGITPGAEHMPLADNTLGDVAGLVKDLAVCCNDRQDAVVRHLPMELRGRLDLTGSQLNAVEQPLRVGELKVPDQEAAQKFRAAWALTEKGLVAAEARIAMLNE